MATNKDFTVTATTSAISPDIPTDYYDNNYGDEMCDATSIMEFGAIFCPVFFSIVVILSLLGNILVIVILAKYENLKSLNNAFILNLAVSDLIFTAGLPFWAYYHMMHEWTLGEPACKIVVFVFYIGYYSSGILLILMTAHRYVAVMNPLSNIVSTKGFYSVLASVIVWAVSILVASPASIFTNDADQNHCQSWHPSVIYEQNTLFIVSSVVFIFCYSQILCRLLRPTAQRRRNKTLKLIFTLVVVFFVTWAPFNIATFLYSLYRWQPPLITNSCDNYKALQYALYIGRIFAYSHCCLNPVFYVFVGIKFKNHLKEMLKSWGRKNTSFHNRQSRLTITSLTSGEEFSM
ncbi:chemokine XC receptor 1-like isoform X1 [Thunnus albacares]|uniref:chemokine XC receptor 1-like isoform X1 n=1 Tax=Thunnus albacares TaxID=8236 RepID=UPI001CF67C64|nr:chemokine XC receptor 1-like isoform X1 [Thunnus albacares]XP_044224915.1 chemokine XC receptor 1-like isoform X1 [Thunnus albacares]